MLPLVLLAFGAGSLLSIQAAINARLGKGLDSPIFAAFCSFASGTLLLLLLALMVAKSKETGLPSRETLVQIPWWAWLGGACGAVYVASITIALPKIGAATSGGLVVAGLITASILLDHFGLFGIERHPINAGRIIGLLLLLAGVALTKRF